MGICQASEDDNIIYTTKSLLDNHTAANNTRLYFSTEPISKLDAECLLLFLDQPYSISKNVFLRRLLNKARADRICNEYRNVIKGRKIQVGQTVVFNINVPGFEFTKIAITHLPQKFTTFLKSAHNAEGNQELVSFLEKSIHKIQEQGMESLIICEFDWKDSNSTQTGFRSIAKTIENYPFKAVVFACLSEQSQTMLMETIQQSRQSKVKL